MKIPAITIYQPWASLIACGAKKFETRSWATKYRGQIAIHAGKGINKFLHGVIDPPRFMFAVQNTLFDNYKHVDMWSNIIRLLPFGAIIATAELVGCHLIYDDGYSRVNPEVTHTKYIQRPYYSREYIQGNELIFGDWTPGRYAWELRDVKMLDEPIPAKGKQRLWYFDLPDTVVGKERGNNDFSTYTNA